MRMKKYGKKFGVCIKQDGTGFIIPFVKSYLIRAGKNLNLGKYHISYW